MNKHLISVILYKTSFKIKARHSFNCKAAIENTCIGKCEKKSKKYYEKENSYKHESATPTGTWQRQETNAHTPPSQSGPLIQLHQSYHKFDAQLEALQVDL